MRKTRMCKQCLFRLRRIFSLRGSYLTMKESRFKSKETRFWAISKKNKEISSGKNTRTILSQFSLRSHLCMICCSRIYIKIKSRFLHTREAGGPELNTYSCSRIYSANFARCRTAWPRDVSSSTRWHSWWESSGSTCTRSWLCGGLMRLRWLTISDFHCCPWSCILLESWCVILKNLTTWESASRSSKSTVAIREWVWRKHSPGRFSRSQGWWVSRGWCSYRRQINRSRSLTAEFSTNFPCYSWRLLWSTWFWCSMGTKHRTNCST